MRTPILMILLLVSCAANCMGKQHLAIMDSVFAVADRQGKKIWHYESDYYYKGTSNLQRRNVSSRIASNGGYYADGGRLLVSEEVGKIEHALDYYYINKARYAFSAVPETSTLQDYNREFFFVSIYSIFMLRNHVLSPLNRKNAKYYRYVAQDTIDANTVRIAFSSRIRNFQLVNGTMDYDVKNKYVTHITFSGDYGIMKYTYSAKMGDDGEGRYWPVNSDLNFRYFYYGNIFVGHSCLYQNYTKLNPHYSIANHQQVRGDMSYLYKMQNDTASVIIDSMVVAHYRPVELSKEEREIYDTTYVRYRRPGNDYNDAPSTNTARFVHAMSNVGETLFSDNNYDVTRSCKFYLYSLGISYSGWKGVTLREDMELNHTSSTGKMFSVKPLIGYNFKPKQFVCRLKTDYLYQPMHLGVVSFEFGNRGIRTSTSRLHDPDTGVRLQPENMGEDLLFNDTYFEMTHSYELFNGFNVLVGASYRLRSPMHVTDDYKQQIHLENTYRSFAPHISLSYTPGQLYYYNGKQKILLNNRYPTITLNYERGMKGILKSDSRYERMEAVVSQNVPLDPIRSLMWKIGGGMFTYMSDANFVDFRYFNEGFTEYSWADEMAGVFQLLDSKYYYDSPHYLRAHVLFQSPTLIFGRINTRYIVAERLYANGLITEGLAPYIELGYGVATPIFDVSFFTSYIKHESLQTGLKFSLHLQR